MFSLLLFNPNKLAKKIQEEFLKANKQVAKLEQAECGFNSYD
ncbi:hypothetical protein [Anabaena catenula]|nr:hypothetical protein [Anabaena catenula]